jgi:hypothetical protein
MMQASQVAVCRTDVVPRRRRSDPEAFVVINDDHHVTEAWCGVSLRRPTRAGRPPTSGEQSVSEFGVHRTDQVLARGEQPHIAGDPFSEQRLRHLRRVGGVWRDDAIGQ